MIASLRGVVSERKPDAVVLDVYGVGYALQIPLSTFYRLAPEGGRQELRVHTLVREDAITLFGFATRTELDIFRTLLTVHGLGPKLALTVLSGMEADALAQCLAVGDVKRLCKIPGIGKKTAERMVMELKDKIAKLALPAGPASTLPAVASSAMSDDLASAMVNLGYGRPDAEKAAEAVLRETPDAPFEALLRAVLRRLTGR